MSIFWEKTKFQKYCIYFTVLLSFADEEEPPPPPPVVVIPPYGTVEWIYYWSDSEGHLPTPINISITGSIKYPLPELKWYNFDVYPHKIKVTNTGYTVLVGAKWKTERPYLTGGPFLDKHVFSQMHFHWGKDLMEGCDHTVDKRRHPGELQVSFFSSEYMTQEEALQHDDGVVMVCYLIKGSRTIAGNTWIRPVRLAQYGGGLHPAVGGRKLPMMTVNDHGVNPDVRLQRFIDAFPRIQEAQTHTRIGPSPLSQLLPMFFEDYFLYWGRLRNVKGDSFVVRWLVPRITLFATLEQMKEFRKLGDPWDEPNLRNFRPLREAEDRHIFFISPHWSQHNSLLPIPRVPEPSLAILSDEYKAKPWMLPPQNAYMIEKDEAEDDGNKKISN